MLTMLAGCSNKESEGAAGQTTKTGDASLKIWVDPGSGDYYNDLLKDYKDESGANVTIEVVESDTAKAQEYLKKDLHETLV